MVLFVTRVAQKKIVLYKTLKSCTYFQTNVICFRLFYKQLSFKKECFTLLVIDLPIMYSLRYAMSRQFFVGSVRCRAKTFGNQSSRRKSRCDLTKSVVGRNQTENL